MPVGGQLVANPVDPVDLGEGRLNVALEWEEVVDNISPAYDQFGEDGSSGVLVTQVPWNRRYEALIYILGYHRVVGDKLRRSVPVRHPYWNFMRATRVLKIEGVKFKEKKAYPGSINAIADYDLARFTVLFETLPYAVLTDNQITNEAQRYVEPESDPAEDAILVEHGTMQYAEGAPSMPTPPATKAFQQTLGIIEPKTLWQYHWHKVPSNYVYTPTGEMTKFNAAIGTVNSVAFGGYEPGTLLFRAPRIRWKVAPFRFKNKGIPYLLTITLNLQHFDPPKGVPASQYRGHLLAPYRDRKYYYITDDGTTGGNPIYPSSDFYDVFKHHAA